MTTSVAARRGRPRMCAILVLCLGLGLVPVGSSMAERVIQRVEARPGGQEVTVVIAAPGGEPLAFRCFTLDAPPRLVIDLPDVRLDAEHPKCLPVGAAGVSQIRLGQFQIDPDIVRLVCDLCEGEQAPRWRKAPGEQPEETLIVLSHGGPPELQLPGIESAGDIVLLRFAAVGELPRQVGELGDPPRVYVDVAGATAEETLAKDFPEGPIRQIRMSQQPSPPDCPVSRAVVELREAQPYTLHSDGSDLVIAIGPRSWALPMSDYQPQERLKGKRIVVDPGHGGPDIGAPATYGPPHQPPFEKDLNLDIGLRLAKLLESEGAHVTLTREDDTYITLAERAATANRLRADAFISIHCNSCRVPGSLHGTSVYYDHAHSLVLADLVQRELVASLDTEDKGVRNANFAVIRRTQVPGILVETAFINHEGDRERLEQPNFRERAARAIVRGLCRFFEESGGTGGPSA
jgi:N-acetylmuramoyl-L-alanine amidase